MSGINDAVWHSYDTPGVITEKLTLLRQWIPSTVRGIVDIGCGNGIICNALADEYDMLGIDISATALEYVRTPKLLASTTAIPLPDRHFDLVHSSEMLEHLSSSDLEKATQEISRLAREYIIISVPDDEQLAKHHCRCADCGHIYQAYGHLQSFDAASLCARFPEFHYVKLLRFGPPEAHYLPSLLWIRQHLAGQYFHPNHAVSCPACGSNLVRIRSNLLSKACNLANSRLAKSRPYWLMLMLKRKP